VELPEALPEVLRAAAHLVGRHEAVVDVEQRVLEALRHERARELLEAQGHPQPVGSRVRRQRVQLAQEQEALDEVQLVPQARILAPRAADGVRDEAPVLLAEAVHRHVGAVDREPGQHLDDGAPEAVERDVAAVARATRDGLHLERQVVDVARHLLADDEALAVGDQRPVRLAARLEALVDAREGPLRARVAEEARQARHELVACRAVRRPVGRERLVVREDLLDDDPGVVADVAAQPREVLLRVVEAVDVVDAQPRQQPGPHQLVHEGVRVAVDALVLDPHRDEPVDVEEAPVVQLLGRDLPERQAEALARQERVEAVERLRAPGLTVERRDICLDVRADLVVRRHHLGQQALHEAHLVAALAQVLARAQRLQHVEHAEQLVAVGPLGAELGLEARHARLEHLVVRLDREREAVVVVRDEEAVLVDVQPDLARLERVAVEPAEDGRQQPPVQGGVGVRPVDVEERAPGRALPALQDVHQHPVARVVGHVVRDDVLDPAEAQLAGRAHKRLERRARAQLLVDLVRVDDVVAVQAAAPRLEHGRGVHGVDAQGGQVRQHLARGRDVERRRELETVGGQRDRHDSADQLHGEGLGQPGERL